MDYEARIEELEAVNRKLNRRVTDLTYMQNSLVQMLGPKGKQVWKMWQDKGVIRQHTSWGPGFDALTGEEVAQVHLELEAAPKTLIKDVD